jgi:hypothetical protein
MVVSAAIANEARYIYADLIDQGIIVGQQFILYGAIYNYTSVNPSTALLNDLANKKLVGYLPLPSIAYSYLIEMLKFNEGLHSPKTIGGVKKSYGTTGTIAYGHNLQGKTSVTINGVLYKNAKTQGLTLDLCQALLEQDVASSIINAKQYLGSERWNWLINNNHYDWACLIVDKIYNNGFYGFLEYNAMLYYMDLTGSKKINLHTYKTLDGKPFIVYPPKTGANLSKQLAGIASNCGSRGLTQRNNSNIAVWVYQSDSYKNASTITKFYSLIKGRVGSPLK